MTDRQLGNHRGGAVPAPRPGRHRRPGERHGGVEPVALSEPEDGRVPGPGGDHADEAKRGTLLQERAGVAMADQAVEPLFHQDDIFALRKGLSYAGRAEGYLAAFIIRPGS